VISKKFDDTYPHRQTDRQADTSVIYTVNFASCKPATELLKT